MQTIVITGASSGLGLETAKALKNHKLILTGRNKEKLEAVASELPNAEVLAFDLSDLDQVRQAAGSIATVDVLINNAGVMGPEFSLSPQGIEFQMATNYLGHFVFTKQLWPVLTRSQSPRVVSLSSVVHRKGNILPTAEAIRGSSAGYDRWQRYADTKLACLLFARELDVRVKQAGSNVVSVAAHPGWALTGLQIHTPSHFDALAQSATQGARSQVLAATGDFSGGEFVGPSLELWGKPKRISGSAKSRNSALAQKLWDATEELIQEQFSLD